MTQSTIAKSQETIERVAIIVATYHDALLRNNIPADTALYLTQDLHERYMDMIFPPLLLD